MCMHWYICVQLDTHLHYTYIPLAVAHTRLYIPACTQGTPDVCDVCTHHVHMHLHMCKHTYTNYTCIYTCTWMHNNTPICTVQMSTVQWENFTGFNICNFCDLAKFAKCFFAKCSSQMGQGQFCTKLQNCSRTIFEFKGNREIFFSEFFSPYSMPKLYPTHVHGHVCTYPLQVALLCGPPGLGKTTLAHIIAKQAGYNVIEMNARYSTHPLQDWLSHTRALYCSMLQC